MKLWYTSLTIVNMGKCATFPVFDILQGGNFVNECTGREIRSQYGETDHRSF